MHCVSVFYYICCMIRKVKCYKIQNVSTHKNVRIIRSELLSVVMLWKLWYMHRSFLGFFQCIIKSFYYVFVRTLIKTLRTKKVIIGRYNETETSYYNDFKDPLVMYDYYHIWKIPVYRITTTNFTEILKHLK